MGDSAVVRNCSMCKESRIFVLSENNVDCTDKFKDSSI